MEPNYSHSILNVTATILKHYHAETPYQTLPVLEEALKDKKHIVLVLLDGMGVNIIHKHLFKDAFLLTHLKDVITSVFPPTTVAATTTVLSGLPPIASGYLGWVHYFPKEDAHIALFPNQDFYDPSKNFEFSFREKYLKYPSLYEMIKRGSPEVSLNELFPAFREDGYQTFKDQVDKVIDITRRKDQSFTYVYWTEPDLTEHHFGIDAYETKKVIQDLDQEVERMAFFVARGTTIVVIADHGLIDVEEVRIFENQELMEMMRRKPSMEARATNFFVKHHDLKRFKEKFEETYGRHFMLLSKQEILDKKLFGEGKKHKMIDQFLGDYIAIATSNQMMSMSSDIKFLAHHAGLTKDEMEVPLIIFSK
ncbi:MAG: hypothetical protein A2Y45_09795 [Tenericutes bacterium GWC2_34_14]|nr:MAG: hypothetical protein A2Z84_05945 [Tenericutes bacterium GWA2_35_7]OHE29635.1 MAG: hypothetical protein A2Y45_09795 [Tenericutes bacterium GWC2_34_14]OHE34215.1 MAG: hypothetical protein A2012_05100 [Tenericutes bacterium GWE2_34_108]OHE35546.1 MAG: hypothetical protein A2Y46_05465 [Tenericutes bacterium GWF1_35_14]OHE38535.1 MAG: hypothetical protein A2Y44_04005 [Tenericutes bacterium GWF2_35_184]OHE41593.1 MAG: hypothetical protein A3K26_08110 [Tenericutes bacterium RIFOXYA12_FULL_35_